MKQKINNSGAILDMCFQSLTFPEMPKEVISRDSYLELFEEQLEDKKVICVDGSAGGVGISITLAMFAKRHSNDCASFFYDGFSRYILSPKRVEASLSSQLMFYADGTVDSVTDNFIQSSLYKIRKKTNSKKEYLYFVFDGFGKIPPEYVDTLKQLIAPLFTIDN